MIWRRKVYDLVAKRFLSIFYPSAQFEITTRITRVEDEPFKTEGKILVFPGWLEIYGREEQVSDDQPSLVPVEQNETVKTDSIEVKDLMTRPPARYTEATLLSAMEGAGKLIDDEELRDAMAAKGLGTPATRAATIEGLLKEEYIAPRRARDQLDAEGFRADGTFARGRYPRAGLARDDGRVGVQAEADGARRTSAQPLHGGDHRADAEDRREGEGLSRSQATRRSRLGSTDRMASRWWRRCAITRRTMARSRCARWWRGVCSSRWKRRSLLEKKLIGPLQGFPLQGGLAFCRRAEVERRGRDGICLR